MPTLFGHQDSLPFDGARETSARGEEMHATRKRLGQFFTPPEVAETLVQWVSPEQDQRILDPSCGDGEFLRCHQNAVGVDVDPIACAAARENAPDRTVVESEFFSWASKSDQQFDAVVGNPPFVRYQSFDTETRELALSLARDGGAEITRLTSTWAPFVVVSATLLRNGGKLSFVVPAEIGHSTYARPVIRFLAERFELVHVVAVREKIFPDLSTDAWLVYAEGYGGSTTEILFTAVDAFRPVGKRPSPTAVVSVGELIQNGSRLRKYLLDREVLAHYEELSAARDVTRLGDLAKIRIGYVTGDNGFFHFKPSDVERLRISENFLKVSVRSGRYLPPDRLTRKHIDEWIADDEEVFLLDLTGVANPPAMVREYLNSEAGQRARQRYKCRTRKPWYIVPDVTTPSAFISCMSGTDPVFALNEAGCGGTNSVLVVHSKPGNTLETVPDEWKTPLSRLSQELEGHPLGGGLLKIEPREAQRIVLPNGKTSGIDEDLLTRGVETMRRWRHLKSDASVKSAA